ncbi:MAG: ABC transporter ATP-binding protein, partial [Candidatus Izimaplasma sp.]|nr:ABC transporter ATP-binding protein [Candidatus Izimaplasma bacterium]
EPTSGLDPLMQQKFFNLISEENKKGATVFFSSHILSEVQQLCNRVAIIKEGEIVKIQDVKDLKTDNYKKFKITGEKLNHGRFDIDGITNLVESEKEVSFFFKGNINGIVKILSGLKLKDVIIEEPTLEEIFMHYYE